MRVANAATGAGLAELMQDRRAQARTWLERAADRYRESWDGAPQASWGRPIGALKARLLAGDEAGAESDARWALDLRSAEAESPIGRYAAALAALVLAEDAEAGRLARSLQEADDAFPGDVADALRGSATGTRRSTPKGWNASCAPSRSVTPTWRTSRSPTPSSSSRSWPSAAASRPVRRRRSVHRRPAMPPGSATVVALQAGEGGDGGAGLLRPRNLRPAVSTSSPRRSSGSTAASSGATASTTRSPSAAFERRPSTIRDCAMATGASPTRPGRTTTRQWEAFDEVDTACRPSARRTRRRGEALRAGGRRVPGRAGADRGAPAPVSRRDPGRGLLDLERRLRRRDAGRSTRSSPTTSTSRRCSPRR